MIKSCGWAYLCKANSKGWIMTFDFTNTLKGVVTQTILKALFERGGYRVTGLGIEELFSEVKHSDLKQYENLNLPMQLRYIPDLLVAEIDMSNVFLVEVKFRKKFDKNSAQDLFQTLERQRKYWGQSYAVIMIAESFVPDGQYHQDFIRVVKPESHHILVDRKLSLVQRWDKFEHLQKVFKRFNNDRHIVDVQKSADTLTQMLKDLAKLQSLK
jgi:hypothetical protein